jgi:ArsR family transcriptional regulator
VEGVPSVVAQLSALGDRVRWAIVRRLRTAPATPTALAKDIRVAPSVLSHHLKVLREAEVIVAVPHGRFIDYALDREVLTSLAAELRNER